ncbi:MAG TPA: DUF1684 domain-containing protein [Candidatus Limnocylindrales bacterium]
MSPGADELSLADWRRRVAELYADVRRIAAEDPAGAWERWRATREALYRDHPQSPVQPDRRATFAAHYFAYDPGLRFELPIQPPPAADLSALAIALPNSGDDVLSFRRIGWIEVPFADRPRSLSLFWMAGYAGGLFLPFRDGTNGAETYGAGRYLLDGAKSADLGGSMERRTLVIDFNFSFQPSCAFDPKWACPLAPPENRLDLPIRAGERLS